MTLADSYVWKARLAPVLLAALPGLALVTAAGFAVDDVARWVGIAVGSIALVICGAVRDRGRRIQAGLWTRWGGPPTRARLRWAGSADVESHARLHERVAGVVGFPLPTLEEEEHDPDRAARQYDEAIATLRQRTYDGARFPLVKAENTDYGFRRNALAVRPVALAVAASSVAVALVLAIAARGSLGARLATWGMAAVIGIASGVFFLAMVRPDWVRLAAERYADQLVLAARDPGI